MGSIPREGDQQLSKMKIRVFQDRVRGTIRECAKGNLFSTRTVHYVLFFLPCRRNLLIAMVLGLQIAMLFMHF